MNVSKIQIVSDMITNILLRGDIEEVENTRIMLDHNIEKINNFLSLAKEYKNYGHDPYPPYERD